MLPPGTVVMFDDEGQLTSAVANIDARRAA
jgi:hypothetical protein